MSSGAFTPAKAATQTYQNGLHHLDEPGHLILLKNIYGGLLLSAAGLLSNIAITGTPGLAATNPGIPRLLQGPTFPVGLICIYFVGAELYVSMKAT
jgi:formate/nitrite transporter FocA (FNT family)